MSRPRKRKGSPYYWYDFTVGGARFRGSTQTSSLEEAKSIIAKLRSDAVNGRHFDKQKERISLNEACARYLIEHGQYLKSTQTVAGHCAHLLDYFGKETCLSSIGNKDVNGYVANRRLQVKEGTGERAVSDTTINRELETFRKLLNLARDKWEVQTGHVNFRQHMLRQPEARTRWITTSEAETLIEKAAPHLKPVIRFALLTGVRLSNITGLQWKDVNLEGKEITFRIKSNIPGGKELALPITDDLEKLLRGLQSRPLYRKRRRVEGDDKKPVMYRPGPEDYVFTYKGDGIASSCRKAFNTACKDAGISDFRFHDLRHTAASWMIQRGIPIDLVQEILGHTQITTTKKYAHRDHSEKRAALESLTSQSRHNEVDAKAV